MIQLRFSLYTLFNFGVNPLIHGGGEDPQNWKYFQQISRVGYVCIEESFDTIFNMDYGSRKSAIDERVKMFLSDGPRGEITV